MRPERDPAAQAQTDTIDVATTPPATDEAATASRATVPDLPGYWLDRLLLASVQLPFAEGEERTLRALVSSLSQILPDTRVGVRMPGEEGGERKVLRSEPPSGEILISQAGRRLFPASRHERIVPLPSELAGGSLHFASDEPGVEDERSPVSHFIQRASMVAADALRRVKEQEQMRAAREELPALTAHLVQAQKLASLGQIAAGMVHELNNPLTAIVAYTDFLLRRTEGRRDADPDDAERLQRIAESANRMLRFTRDLVAYARPSSETAVPVALHSVIDRALAFCEHELVLARATVVREFDPEVHTVHGMPEQLAQIFVNLVTNACHAMAPPASPESRPPSSEEGRLFVATSLLDGARRVRVTVEDNGCGIDPGHQAMIFAPFFTTKGVGVGTGLGLSIVKNIVERHGGEIRVESASPRGARFVVVLPVER